MIWGQLHIPYNTENVRRFLMLDLNRELQLPDLKEFSRSPSCHLDVIWPIYISVCKRLKLHQLSLDLRYLIIKN